MKLNGKVVNEYTGEKKIARGYVGLQNHDPGDVVYFTAKGDPASDFTTRWSVSGSGAIVDANGAFVAEFGGARCVQTVREALTLTRAIRDKSKIEEFLREVATKVGLDIEQVRGEFRRAKEPASARTRSCARACDRWA